MGREDSFGREEIGTDKYEGCGQTSTKTSTITLVVFKCSLHVLYMYVACWLLDLIDHEQRQKGGNAKKQVYLGRVAGQGC